VVFCGIFVELPSQLNERWLPTPGAALGASPCITRPASDAGGVDAKGAAGAHFRPGVRHTQYLACAILDLEASRWADATPTSTPAPRTQALERLGMPREIILLPPAAATSPMCFPARGYAAGYYN